MFAEETCFDAAYIYCPELKQFFYTLLEPLPKAVKEQIAQSIGKNGSLADEDRDVPFSYQFNQDRRAYEYTIFAKVETGKLKR